MLNLAMRQTMFKFMSELRSVLIRNINKVQGIKGTSCVNTI